MTRLWMWLNGRRRDRAIQNVFYMSLVQIAGLLLPLLTFPWMTRALQPEGLGTYAFALAFLSYFQVLVDFGFGLAGTKKVAEIRDNNDALDRYFWAAQSVRALLCVLACAVTLAITFVVPDLRRIYPVVLASLPLLLGSLLFPHWLFAGLERLGLVSVANITARLLSVPAVFLFVHSPSDAWVAALIVSLSGVVGGLIAVWLIMRNGLVGRFILPRAADLRHVFSDAFHLFLSSASVQLYAATNSFVLGLVSSPAQVGLFSAGDRVRGLSVAPIVPVSTAYFPRVSRAVSEDPVAARRLLRKLLVFLAVGMGCMSVGIFVTADYIVHLLMGPSFNDAVPVLRIMSAIPFVVAVNTVLGSLTMINFGLKKQFTLILMICGALNVGLLLVLASAYGAIGAASAVLITEVGVTLWMGIYVWRRRLL